MLNNTFQIYDKNKSNNGAYFKFYTIKLYTISHIAFHAENLKLSIRSFFIEFFFGY